MFIHWGLYSVLAGRWRGKLVPGIGEWIMYFGQIPVEQYEQVARRFSARQFDASQWVRLAKRAGMKYLVITAKHHDGFAMYDSPCSDYNVVKATPFARDPMKDLAQACHEQGVRLCFYYSQTQDWHHPGGGGHWQRGDRKTVRVDPQAFADYLEQKVKPQLRELLTQYGPVGLIWFDTPQNITRQQSLDLKRWVKSFQRDCLVCGRIGNGVGDYHCLSDNMIPVVTPRGAWETPATINDTWAFKRDDDNWKSTGDLLLLLVDLASKGVNYLLNIGPTGAGAVPEPCVDRLEALGDWLAINGESIYGTQASPFPQEFSWGRMTRKRGRLYLHILNWPRSPLTLMGLGSAVRSAYLLADRQRPLRFSQGRDPAGEYRLTIQLPSKAPDTHVSVLCLELAGPLRVDASLRQQMDGSVSLPAQLGVVSPRRAIAFALNGRTNLWQSLDTTITWRFKVHRPGLFDLQLLTGFRRRQPWSEGCRAIITLDGKCIADGELRRDDTDVNPRTQYDPEVISRMGCVSLRSAGEHVLTFQLTHLPAEAAGFVLSSARLVPRPRRRA
jgi:alpha-L-fucosidase